MDKPAAPPDASLIRLVREAAGMSTQDVARKAGISAVRLTQVENGYETRNGQIRAVHAKPGTMAHIAHALEISPERLEQEGQRPDAAPILREILRSEEEARAVAEAEPEESESVQEVPASGLATVAAANAIAALMEPAIQSVWTDVNRARMRNPHASATEIFSNAREVRLWGLDALPEDERAGYIAFLRVKRNEEDTENAARENGPQRPRRAK